MTLSRPVGSRLNDRAPRPLASRPAKGISDSDFDALLAQWFTDPRSSNITIAVRIETNGVTIRIRDRETVAAMLAAEVQRRKDRKIFRRVTFSDEDTEAREAAS